MLRKILILYLFVIQLELVVSKLYHLSEEQEKLRYSLTKCVLSAATEFKYRDIITVALTTRDYSRYTNSTIATDTVLLKALYIMYQWSLVVTKSNIVDTPSIFFKKSDNYIIQFRHSDEFLSMLNSLTLRKSWNPHAKFVILTSTLFPDHTPIVSPIVEILWKVRVLNAIILMPQKLNSSKITVYSWFPYSNGHCGDGFDETDIINICKYGQFLNNTLLFPNKISNDMQECPVRVRAVIWPPFIIKPRKVYDVRNVNFTKGIEIMLMNTIAKVANFSVIYSLSEKEQDWGNIFRNRTATGMMKTLLNEEVDVGLGALATLLYRHFHFDSSVTYYQESITWCVPHALPEPRWRCLLIIFHPLTWLTLCASYILVTLTMAVLNATHKRRERQNGVIETLQNNYSVILGIAITLPKEAKARMVIITWIIICFILNASYHSSLISFLTKPIFEKQIETVEEMLEQGYKFGIVPPSVLFIKHDINSNLNLSNLVSCDNVKSCLDRTAFRRDFVVGVPRMYMVYSSRTYISSTGENLVYWTKEDIVSYPIEMIMVKGYPLQGRINQIIHRIVEAGLLSKWAEDLLSKNTKISSKHPKTIEGSKNDVILTLNHLEGAFILLLIGLSVAGIIFICELMYFKYLNSKKANILYHRYYRKHYKTRK